MTHQCKAIGCEQPVSDPQKDFCTPCEYTNNIMNLESGFDTKAALSTLDDLDIYAIHHMFNLQDPSGCLQQASRSILMSGIENTGTGKPLVKDIEQARNLLNRWLELNTSVRY